MKILDGFNAGFAIKQSATPNSRSSAVPSFDNNRVWNSLGDFTKAVWKYEDDCAGVYAKAFSQGENGGKMTVDALREQLRSEFGGFGVRLVDSAPEDPVAGQHLIHIDETNLRKMANDPEYRARTFAVIQAEMASARGYKFRQNGGTVSGSLTGTVTSISENNAKSCGDVPYSGMATGMSTQTGPAQSGPASSGGGVKKSGKGRSMLEIIKEMQEKRLEERREKKKAEAARSDREEALEALRQVEGMEVPAAEAPPADSAARDQSQSPARISGGLMDLVG